MFMPGLPEAAVFRRVMAAIELAQPTKKNLIPLFISPRIIVFKIISSAVKVVGGGIVGRRSNHPNFQF